MGDETSIGVNREACEDDATPTSFYDLKRLHNDLRRNAEALREVWREISGQTAASQIAQRGC